MTILSIQINTEYWDYRQCCNLRAAVPWRCRWCGCVYADMGHAAYSAGTTVCQVASYPQARNIVLAAADRRVYTLRTVRLWSQCAVISVPDTAHHTPVSVQTQRNTHKYASGTIPHTSLGPRHSIPHTTFGPRHSTPHTTFGPRHGTPHTTFGPRQSTPHTSFGPRHGTTISSFLHNAMIPYRFPTHTNVFCESINHLNQTTFTCTPRVIQNHSTNIT